jgi:hypothetical protein
LTAWQNATDFGVPFLAKPQPGGDTGLRSTLRAPAYRWELPVSKRLATAWLCSHLHGCRAIIAEALIELPVTCNIRLALPTTLTERSPTSGRVTTYGFHHRDSEENA